MTKIIFTFAGHPDLLMQSMYKKLGNPSDEKDMIDRKKAKSKRSTNTPLQKRLKRFWQQLLP